MSFTAMNMSHLVTDAPIFLGQATAPASGDVQVSPSILFCCLEVDLDIACSVSGPHELLGARVYDRSRHENSCQVVTDMRQWNGHPTQALQREAGQLTSTRFTLLAAIQEATSDPAAKQEVLAELAVSSGDEAL